MTAMPLSDCDSVCSTSLTSVAIPRSTLPVMRCSISCGSRPVKVQTRLMTGILISGKISVGVRSKTTGVSRMITSAITINVYGLCSAKRTIHILFFEFLQSGDFVVTRTLRPAAKTTMCSLLDRENRGLVTSNGQAASAEYHTSLEAQSHQNSESGKRIRAGNGSLFRLPRLATCSYGCGRCWPGHEKYCPGQNGSEL